MIAEPQSQRSGFGVGRPTMSHHIPFGLLASSRIFK